MCSTRFRRISPANIGPKRFHHSRTVSWQGSVKPNAFGGDFHDLLGERPDIEGARSPRLVLCLFKKAMAAARNRERGEGDARSGAFGLTTPVKLGNPTNLTEAGTKRAQTQRAGTDAFAANVLPIVRQIQAAGANTLGATSANFTGPSRAQDREF
jgi:hypothetical protein